MKRKLKLLTDDRVTKAYLMSAVPDRLLRVYGGGTED
jgi:hypothetical protein